MEVGLDAGESRDALAVCRPPRLRRRAHRGSSDVLAEMRAVLLKSVGRRTARHVGKAGQAPRETSFVSSRQGASTMKTVAVLRVFATSPGANPKAACGGSSAPACGGLLEHDLVDCGRVNCMLCYRRVPTDARLHDNTQAEWHDVLGGRFIRGMRSPFFKPALLNAKTVHAIRDKLQNDPRWSFDYVYYSEADQVLHTRNARFMLSVIDENTYVSPHRMQPIAHPSDMPSLATAEGRDWLPRWSQQDLDRMARIGPVIDVDRAKNWRCCVGRSECTATVYKEIDQRGRPESAPSSVVAGAVMVAATKGRTASSSFAVARWRKVQKRVPSTIGWLRSRLRFDLCGNQPIVGQRREISVPTQEEARGPRGPRRQTGQTGLPARAPC